MMALHWSKRVATLKNIKVVVVTTFLISLHLLR